MSEDDPERLETRTVDPGRPAPLYAAVERTLEQAIAGGRLAPGTVLTEGPVAALFGSSRTPVRTAMGELAARGMLERFAGRGFLVPGGEAPRRVKLTPAMLGLEEGAPEPQMGAAERIARDFEGSVARALPFGLFRVHEQAAADHYDVSRNVIRELLSRLQDRGLVQKNPRSHWMIGPLTARDVAHYFAIREALEPLALAESAPRLPGRELADMLERVVAAQEEPDDLPPPVIEELESDLHVRLLAASPNPHLLRMIRQSQIALVVNRVFAEFVGSRPFALAMGEHRIVLEFLTRGSWQAGADAMAEHMRLSAERTRRRLMAVSVFPQPELPGYLIRESN
ncbi:GntR family transcriptional regulator [Albimonas pacifica]|uniref:Transcriptional regulator, GntR family n=1 Tax=Albimonas pacifica TaxID=1114924 RepID=A0A1I3CKF0_9RHOB|nr:GntR family transcriptional regulator [Albimonas pacifica]SFH74962.1 transcriptional regulator, GntR family [Albimonas pacifica]